MKMNVKSFVIGVLIGIAVGSVFSIVFMRVLPMSQSSYTKLTVTHGSWAEIDFGSNRYCFMLTCTWDSNGKVIDQEISLSNGETQLEIWWPHVGETREWRGVEIVVSEVHSDYMIFLIKPL